VRGRKGAQRVVLRKKVVIFEHVCARVCVGSTDREFVLAFESVASR
jgi:hypothetical protein